MDSQVRATILDKLQKSMGPSIMPAWRTALHLVEGLEVKEAFDVISKLAAAQQRGFPSIKRQLEEAHEWLGVQDEDEETAGT